MVVSPFIIFISLCSLVLAGFGLGYMVFLLWRDKVMLRRRNSDLTALRALIQYQSYGVVVFDDAGLLTYASDFGRECMPFMDVFASRQRSVSFDDALEYLGLQSQAAHRDLGGDIWARLDRGPRGEFQEIISVQNRGYCLAQALTLEDRSRAIVFSDFDPVMITDNTQDRSEAAHHDKMQALSKLAGGLAHDFNNVLSIISGFARLAGKEGTDVEVVEAYIDKITGAAARGANLTHKMMMFSNHKIETNRVIDASKLLQDAEGLLFVDVPPNVQRVVRTHVEGAYMRTQNDAVMQIAEALISNAVEAMPDGGILTLDMSLCAANAVPSEVLRACEGVEDYVRLCVTDTGEGMSPDVLAKMFDPFFTTRDHGRKSGLGLSLVYGLVRQLGGAVHVRSTPRRGTDIELYFPLSDVPPSRDISGDVSDARSLQMRGYTALVVDDEVELLQIVGGMLEEMGLTVFTQSDPNQALLFQEEHEGVIDVLLTDVVMAGLDGIKLAALIKSEREDMDVIFMSGYPARGALNDVRLPEDCAFLAKPLDYDVLAACLYAHFDPHGAEDVSAPRGGQVWRNSETGGAHVE